MMFVNNVLKTSQKYSTKQYREKANRYVFLKVIFIEPLIALKKLNGDN